MSYARVCGDSVQARGLNKLLSQTLLHIDNCVTSMEHAASSIRSGWDDDGVGEVDEILSAIRTSLNNAREAMPSVTASLEAYAAFLDER